jgi:hypothetical protein
MVQSNNIKTQEVIMNMKSQILIWIHAKYEWYKDSKKRLWKLKKLIK